AIDHENGSIYVTLSGTRGQKVPVSIYRISPDGTVSPFNSDIINPTGMAFDREGSLYVTNRNDGTLHRITHFNEEKTVASRFLSATAAGRFTASTKLARPDPLPRWSRACRPIIWRSGPTAICT